MKCNAYHPGGWSSSELDMTAKGVLKRCSLFSGCNGGATGDQVGVWKLWLKRGEARQGMDDGRSEAPQLRNQAPECYDTMPVRSRERSRVCCLEHPRDCSLCESYCKQNVVTND